MLRRQQCKKGAARRKANLKMPKRAAYRVQQNSCKKVHVNKRCPKNARSWCKESFESYLQDHVLFVKTVPDDMSSTTILNKWAHPFQEGISKRLQDKMSPKRGATQSVTLKRGNTGCSLPAYKNAPQKMPTATKYCIDANKNI